MTEDKERQPVTPAKALSLYKGIIKKGEATWQDWLDIGRFVFERQARAAARAHATRGTVYAGYLEKFMGVFYPTYKKLSDNGTVHYLGHCLVNLEVIESFRNGIDESKRPNHPQRVWKKFSEKLQASMGIDFQSAEAEIAEEEEDEDKDERTPRKAHAKTGHNQEKALLHRIAFLEERLDEQVMTADPDLNGERIWRRLVEVLGHGRSAGELAMRTAERLLEIGRKIVGDADEWDGKK